jgi:hypothetical protein
MALLKLEQSAEELSLLLDGLRSLSVFTGSLGLLANIGGGGGMSVCVLSILEMESVEELLCTSTMTVFVSLCRDTRQMSASFVSFFELFSVFGIRVLLITVPFSDSLIIVLLLELGVCTGGWFSGIFGGTFVTSFSRVIGLMLVLLTSSELMDSSRTILSLLDVCSLQHGLWSPVTLLAELL